MSKLEKIRYKKWFLYCLEKECLEEKNNKLKEKETKNVKVLRLVRM